MSYTSNDVKKLRKQTGCSLAMCKNAFDYAETHENCKPIGFLRASLFGGYRNETFEDTVRRYSVE